MTTPAQPHRHRILARAVTLALAVGIAVVGNAGAAGANTNAITGSVTCAKEGGWAVTWRVANSADMKATVTASNRAVVPVGTTIEPLGTPTFTETVTTMPGSTLTLTLTATWDGKTTVTSSGSIEPKAFPDCAVTPPTVPVVDACGPGNASYGTVPKGPWTVVRNPDGSLTITADTGYYFGKGETVITYPAPTDSNQPCVVTPPPTPPVVTPVVTPPEVAPAEVRVVRAAARQIDKCGRASDLFRVAKRSGVVYRANGKVVREGVWHKATTRSVTVRARAARSTYDLRGKQVWKMTFSARPCAQAPEVAPDTGA